MTLRVFTTRLSYVGADRLDITRAGADAYRKRTGLDIATSRFGELIRGVGDAKKTIDRAQKVVVKVTDAADNNDSK